MKITIKIHYFSLVNVGILAWAITLWIIPTSGQLLLSEVLTTDLLPLCCEKDSAYSIGFDLCESNVFKQELIRPQIFNATKDNNSLNINYDNISDCDDGFVANISTNFRILENGSLFILSPIEILIPEERFCIDEFQTMNAKDPTALVARFCAPDPCIGRKCVPKCCPHGMVLNYTEEYSYQCQIITLNYSSSSIQLRNEHGVSIRPSKRDEIPTIRDGAAPECPGDITEFEPHADEYFSILPNGSIFILLRKIGEIKSDQYCVDHLLKEDGTLSDDHIAISCIPPSVTSRINEEESSIILSYPYFLFVSSIFLIATFVVYAIIPEIQNVHGISIMCHVVALAVMYIGLGIIQINPDAIAGRWCTALASVTHFAFLSSFTWLSVMSFDIWWTFRNIRPTVSRDGKMHKGRRRLIFYSVYSWSVPLIIALTGVITDEMFRSLPKEKFWFESEEERQSYLSSRPTNLIRPRFREGWCWFSYNSLSSSTVYLYGPISCITLINIIFFILTVNALHRTSNDTALAAGRIKAWQKFRVIFSIFILMGLSWIFQIASYAVVLSEHHNFLLDKSGKGGSLFLFGQSAIGITIDIVIYIINALAIFVMFVCKPTIWNRLQSKFPILKRAGGNVLTFFVTKKRVNTNSFSNQQESSGSGSTNITDSHNIGNPIGFNKAHG